MADKLIIDTKGGISADVNFFVDIKPGVHFEIGTDTNRRKYVCVVYDKSPSRQCYKCAFCHSINLCSHFLCNPKSRHDGKMVKFNYAK